MTWALLTVLVVALLVPVLSRRRRRLFTASRCDPISSLPVELSRKTSRRMKEALDAANSVLR